MTQPYPTWLEIDLDAIRHNTRLIASAAQVPLLAVVKDNGYGHGAAPVARAFLEAGGAWLGVARAHEAADLRAAGIDAPLLVMGGVLPEEAEAMVRQNVTIALYDSAMVEHLADCARRTGRTAHVHLKIDTGMGRFGVFSPAAGDLAAQAARAGLAVEGVFTHFASADDDPELTALQMERFRQALDGVRKAGVEPRWVHCSNSSAIIERPEARFNLVRAGGILYGLNLGHEHFPWQGQLRHALTWKARLMSVRRMPAGWTVSYGARYQTREGEWIGVVPVGHGDGFRRVDGNEVLVGGQRVPVVGAVCMDQFMVSLPEGAQVGDEVVLIGSQGGACIPPEEVRNRWKSTYSGVFLIHPRVPRIVFN